MVVENLYSDLQVTVTTKRWSTSLLPCKIGVFQGDPFSLIVINTVINTLAIQLKQVTPALGYRLNRSAYVIDALLFADDVTLSKGLQKLCDIVSKWCQWSIIVIKVPKCSCLKLSYQTKCHNHHPSISICGQTIPFLGNKTFKISVNAYKW